ncbi:hypothetical protein JOC77_000859 [Peribacillus deserti]|uniref:YugN-like family protein n=1 Tax=Peribacillus deserti TaxID=673318 RepID=A0ABS2QF52_9BACI|nr:YugN family protein [Peribacillus deserti]MBM7691454.1 hypothetical protein [Peribacillus deserti]
MIPIQSTIEGKQLALGTLKKALEPLGFHVGDNWEYDHAHLDYKIDDEHGDQQYIRIPFHSLGDSLEKDRALVQIGTPFLLDHQFETEVDDEGNIGAVAASVDQFKSPADRDAPFPDRYKEFGMKVIEQVEAALSQHIV